MKLSEYPTVELDQPTMFSWFDSGCNVMLIGKHGTGKTARIIDTFEKKAPGKWAYFSGATLDPFTDIIGIPRPKDDGKGGHVIEYVRPDNMNLDLEAIFVDEYNRMHKRGKNALMELIQFKSINGRKYPNLKVVWIAVNPDNEDEDNEEFRYDVDKMDCAQQDRFHIIVNVSNDPCPIYFRNKFGDGGTAAIEWHRKLPANVYISPRRLEYICDMAINKRIDVTCMVPKSANINLLLSVFKRGPFDKLLEKYDNNADKIEALFKDAKHRDEILHRFRTDSVFRKKYLSMVWQNIPKEQTVPIIKSMGVYEATGVKFDLSSAEHRKQLSNMIVKNAGLGKQTEIQYQVIQYLVNLDSGIATSTTVPTF